MSERKVSKFVKNFPRGRNLTFTRCPGVGNLTLASMKMSNSPGTHTSSCHVSFVTISSQMYKFSVSEYQYKVYVGMQ